MGAGDDRVGQWWRIGLQYAKEANGIRTECLGDIYPLIV